MANNSTFIGHYRIVAEHINGAFGSVYRCEDTTRQDAIVVVKLLQNAHLSSQRERDSFLQEAQRLTQLQHPAILPILDVGIEQDFPYFVMEYAPRGSLQERMAQLAPQLLPIKESLTILRQIGSALQYAHQQNFIHRDLKPSNVLFQANGTALLADFGNTTVLATSVKYGPISNTPSYMAPEQFRGVASKEGDQYALGCIAYELFTGRLPFNAPDFFALGQLHMEEVPVPPTYLNPLLPFAIEQAILKTLAKQRSDRYADVATFLAALGIPLSMPATLTNPTNTQEDTSVENETDEDATIHARPLPASKQPQGAKRPAPKSKYRHVEIGQNVPQTPLPNRIDREEKGVIPLFGAAGTVTPLPLAGTPRNSAYEEVGKTFSPADTLPRIIDETSRESVPPRPNAPLSARVNEEEGVNPFALQGAAQSMSQTQTLLPSQMGYQQPSDREVAFLETIPALPFPPPPPSNINVFHSANQEDAPNPAVVTNSNRYPGKHRRVRRLWLITMTLALLLLLVGGGVFYSLYHAFNPKVITSHLNGIPFVPVAATTIPTATVMITPARNALSDTYTIYAVTGTPNAAQQQVAARPLSAASATQSSTVSATGKGTIPATRAGGMLSIQNLGATNLAMAAGQGFVDYTGKQSVIIDSTIYISAYSTVTVHGHSGNLGSSGNMNAYYFNFDYGWQGSTILLQNITAMSGGQDAQSYTYLQNSDINSAVAAANSLKGSLTTSTQSAIYGQVRSNERLVGAVPCTPHVTYNHRSGDRVSSVTTTVSVTCAGEVYDQQGALSLAATLLQNKVFSPYLSYTLIGSITTSLLQANIVNGSGTIALQVKATGEGKFQFSDTQKQDMAKLIIGNSVQYAQSLLLKQTGVSQVSITVFGGDGKTLPVNSGRITIVVSG